MQTWLQTHAHLGDNFKACIKNIFYTNDKYFKISIYKNKRSVPIKKDILAEILNTSGGKAIIDEAS